LVENVTLRLRPPLTRDTEVRGSSEEK